MIDIIAMPSGPSSETSRAPRDLHRILLVVDQLERTLGGGERIVLKLAMHLPHYGFRASILTFSADPESAALKSPPCPIYLLPLQHTFDLSALRAAFEFSRFLKRQRIDIVHTFFGSSDIWAGLVTKTMSNAKLVWARRDMGILRTRKQRVAYRLMAGRPDAVLAVSERVRRHSIDVDLVEPERVQTIYNGLDLADWETASRQFKVSSEFLVTTVGNIRRVKGHDLFIRAAAAVVRQFPKAFFTIAGDVLEPDYFAELQTLVQDLNLGKHFRFDGGITNLHQHLAEADVFVLPSRSEGFSNAIIEAMAASLPVVATDVGGNAEAVIDGTSGFLVPSEDPDALAAAILMLLSDPAKANAMGLSGRNAVAERFTTEIMMDQTARAYREVLSER